MHRDPGRRAQLTPQTLDQGFHAIPMVESTNPQLPTCYYLAGDYTCVKDSIIEHWDDGADAVEPQPWLLADGRQRQALPAR